MNTIQQNLTKKNLEFFIQMELCDQTLSEYLKTRNTKV